MAEELLATKLHVPLPRADAVSRPRLVDLVGKKPVTLVSAPAGYGKTTLVSDWARAEGAAIAWVSLDAADNDPGRYWSYVVTALRTLDDSVGEPSLALLRSPQPVAIESLLLPLINEIAASESDIVLVLEDLHEITSEEIMNGLAYVVEHLPAHVRIVLITRVDPALPLASLRATSKLGEIRASDLRFTENEAATFLRHEAGVELSKGDVAALEARTEGWAVGLQMAAISMRSRGDIGTFIEDFSGSHRYVLDYLVQEVLDRQPDDVQEFLVKTSFLQRLNGSLCDAVTGRGDGQTTLEALERQNLFTTPLDDERRWYRYHYLFAESLRRILMLRHADEVIALRRIAVGWLEENGLPREAISYALAAADYDAAARLIEHEAEQALWLESQRVTVATWLEALPRDVVRSRPKLALIQCWAMFTTGKWEAVGPLLDEIDDEIAGDDESLAIAGEVAAIRSGIAYEAGQMEESRAFAQRALDLVPHANPTVRSVVAFQLGLALHWMGDDEAARANYDLATEIGRVAQNLTIVLLALGCQVQLASRQGRLRDAESFYQQARQAGNVAGAALAPLGLAYVQMGAVFREHNELIQAGRVLAEGIALCEQQGGMPEYVLEGLIMRARVLFDQGELDEMAASLRQADALLDEMRLRSGDVQAIISPALVHRGRLALAQGDVPEATNWAESTGFDIEGEIDRTNQGAAILTARLLLAGGETSEALKLADRLENLSAESNVEPLVVKSMALETAKPEAARAALIEALLVAEREGYVRIFLDAGDGMRSLLEVVVAETGSPYAKQLLLLFEDGQAIEEAREGGTIHEALNERELSLLRCMSSGLSNQEIASELYLSVNTVKWHARNLYGKLGVQARSKAVARARELGLL